jgi:hypothetical protein
VARAFVEARGKNDLVNVKWFDDATWHAGSGWTNDAGALTTAIDGIAPAPEKPGRSRPLFDLIKNATLEGFGELGNRDQKGPIPLHQTLVVLSDAWAGTDFGGSSPALAQQLGRLLADGVLEENNAAATRAPVPVIAVWFPAAGFEEAFENARQFMQNLSVPSIGGNFFIMPDGRGSRAKRIAEVVRQRFDGMHVVEWRLPCLAASTSQTFKLLFLDADKPILGDGWRNVPFAVDPRKWPLAVDAESSGRKAEKEPLEPGGTATLFGRFCWGTNHERAEVYLLPKGQDLAADGTPEEARRARDDLTAKGFRATALRSGDGFVEVRLPDNDGFLADGTARLVVVDGHSKRTSSTAQVLTLKAGGRSWDLWRVLGIFFGISTIALLGAIFLRTGGPAARRRASVAPSRPVVAGGSSAAGEISGIMMPPSAPVASRNPSSVPAVSQPMSAPATSAPATPQSRGDVPMSTVLFSGGAPAGGVRAARLGGKVGVFPVPPGREVGIGRDPGLCAIALPDANVSALHARVKIDGGRLLVWDEASENGTFLNGARLPPRAWVPVPHGAVLRFAAVDLMVQLE